MHAHADTKLLMTEWINGLNLREHSWVFFCTQYLDGFYGLRAGTELFENGLHWFGALVTEDMVIITIIIIIINSVLGYTETTAACFMIFIFNDQSSLDTFVGFALN